MSARPCRVADDPTGLEPLLRATLAEDIGRGDITTRLTVPVERMATATLIQKQDGVMAGAPVFEAAFAVFDPSVTIEWLAEEGSAGGRRDVAILRGPARSLLTAERTGLNFIQRLSGIATQAQKVLQVVEGTGVTILDTRKTTPGLRTVEKYACRVGGARNHRAGLDDGVLIKDNHLAAAGSITAAVTAALKGAPSLVKIECEVTDLAGLEEAIRAGADIVLLDNMTPEMVREAKRITAGRAILEASGGITLANVRAYAEAGVDYISLGALTHSAQAIDFSLDFHLEDHSW